MGLPAYGQADIAPRTQVECLRWSCRNLGQASGGEVLRPSVWSLLRAGTFRLAKQNSSQHLHHPCIFSAVNQVTKISERIDKQYASGEIALCYVTEVGSHDTSPYTHTVSMSIPIASLKVIDFSNNSWSLELGRGLRDGVVYVRIDAPVVV